MKRTVMRFIIATIAIVGAIYLFLVFAVNDKKSEFKKLKETEPDSISINDSVYHIKRKINSTLSNSSAIQETIKKT